MYRIPGVLSAATKPAPDVPPAPPARHPQPVNPQALEHGYGTGSAWATSGQAEDHKPIATGLDDVVAGRLRTASLDLQAALGLLGDHLASGKIRHAMTELDQAIRDIQDTDSGHPGHTYDL